MSPLVTTIANSGARGRVAAPPYVPPAAYTFSTSFEGMTTGISPTPTYPNVPANTWGWVDQSPEVSSALAYTGTQSLMFAYPAQPIPGEVSREQKFGMAQKVSEFWFSFYWYVPSNFKHRFVGGAGSTCKLFQIWQGWYGNPSNRWGVTFNRMNDDRSSFYPTATRGNEYDVTQAPIQNFPSAFGKEYFIGTPNCIITPGGWYRLRFHFKPASSRYATDGIWKCWVNDTLYMDGGGMLWSPTAAIGTQFENDVEVSDGYLMGSSNMGYEFATTFYIDDVFLTTANPGW